MATETSGRRYRINGSRAQCPQCNGHTFHERLCGELTHWKAPEWARADALVLVCASCAFPQCPRDPPVLESGA